jgi:tRNA-2-methylthio-N6-dimethylallyladenosine synthase
MNENDSEIVNSILQQNKMEIVHEENDADLILLNTCAIRENAEQKIWQKLNSLKIAKKSKQKENKKLIIGVLGCMAERLKTKIVEEQKSVDLIVGPDSYKDLPRLVNMLFDPLNSNMNNYAINTQLSIDETYSDIIPIRVAENAIEAYISIMRYSYLHK